MLNDAEFSGQARSKVGGMLKCTEEVRTQSGPVSRVRTPFPRKAFISRANVPPLLVGHDDVHREPALNSAFRRLLSKIPHERGHRQLNQSEVDMSRQIVVGAKSRSDMRTDPSKQLERRPVVNIFQALIQHSKYRRSK